MTTIIIALLLIKSYLCIIQNLVRNRFLITKDKQKLI